MTLVNREALVVIATERFLNWLKSVDASNADLTMEDLLSEPSIYLVGDTGDDVALERTLRRHARTIFEEELLGWWRDESAWPAEREFEQFQEWFEVSHHSMLFDLESKPIRREKV